MTGAMENCTYDSGVLYYARGEGWVREAIVSAMSVREAMPACPVAIFCSDPLPAGLFDLQLPLPADVSVKQGKMHALAQSPFEKTLYLDTDTYLADPVHEVFDLLGHFEFAAVVTPAWKVPASSQGSEIDGIPVCFPTINGGVLAFRRTPATARLIAAWAALHAEWDGGQDQRSLRAALFRSGLRYAAMSHAYNYRLPYPDGVAGTVKILHGREDDLKTLAQRINQVAGWRITCPNRRRGRKIFYGPEHKPARSVSRAPRVGTP
jgi:hypothetical protein